MRPKRYAAEYAAANLPIYTQDIEWKDIVQTPERAALMEDAKQWLRGIMSLHNHGHKPTSRTQAFAKRLFLIYGPPNCGKTMFASLIAKSLLKRNVKVYRAHLERYVKASFVKPGTPDTEMEIAFQDMLRQIAVLILEIGEEPDHRYAGPRLVELLKHRIEHGFPTIVVSSQGPDYLVTKYGNDICKASEIVRLFKDPKTVLTHRLYAKGLEG
jgi:DNA replication protein DnaC